jgi:hypothetical protein
MGRGLDFPGPAVAERAVLPADAALQRGYLGGSHFGRQENSIRKTGMLGACRFFCLFSTRIVFL